MIDEDLERNGGLGEREEKKVLGKERGRARMRQLKRRKRYERC